MKSIYMGLLLLFLWLDDGYVDVVEKLIGSYTYMLMILRIINFYFLI